MKEVPGIAARCPVIGIRTCRRRQMDSRHSRQEVRDGLYDNPHRLLRPVHVRTEMTPISGKQMGGVAPLGRGKDRPILLRKRRFASIRGDIRNASDGPQQRLQSIQGRRILPFEVPARLGNTICAGHDFPGSRTRQFDHKGGFPFRIMSRREKNIRIQEDAGQRFRPTFLKILDLSSGESRSSLFHRAISSSV